MSLEIHFVYCGNGDTILVRSQDDWGIIDSNLTTTSKAKQRLVGVLDSNNVRRLRFACVTHYDADHLRGMADFLRDRFSDSIATEPSRRVWRIEQVVQPLRTKDLRNYALFQSAIERINNCKIDLDFSREAAAFLDLTKQMLRDTKGLQASHQVYMPSYTAPSVLANPSVGTGRALFGHFEVWFLGPEQQVTDQFEEDVFLRVFKQLFNAPEDLVARVTANSLSRVIAFRDINSKAAVLFAADAPSECWMQILERWNQCRHIGVPSDAAPQWKEFSVIKVSHHGAKDGHDARLYSEFSTRNRTVAIITCRPSDPKHPHQEVIRDLMDKAILVERTAPMNETRAPMRTGSPPGGAVVHTASAAVDLRVRFDGEAVSVSRSAVNL